MGDTSTSSSYQTKKNEMKEIILIIIFSTISIMVMSLTEYYANPFLN